MLEVWRIPKITRSPLSLWIKFWCAIILSQSLVSAGCRIALSLSREYTSLLLSTSAIDGKGLPISAFMAEIKKCHIDALAISLKAGTMSFWWWILQSFPSSWECKISGTDEEESLPQYRLLSCTLTIFHLEKQKSRTMSCYIMREREAKEWPQGFWCKLHSFQWLANSI